MIRPTLKLFSSRLTWYLIGLLTIPVGYTAYSWIFPSPKSAMGFVGYYEENLSLYTALGDHRYSLAFPGDSDDFHTYARKIGLSEHRVSETEYAVRTERAERKLLFKASEGLHAIQYSSASH
jgi:hypothetical protein